MSFTPLEYLRHMLVEAEFLTAQTETLSRTEFLENEVLRRALVRSLEVIGEAARQVPPEFRVRYPQIEWRVMAGMRDRLIHGYFGVDYDIVWSTATRDAPSLKRHLEQILAAEGETGS
jgi:uncharacterized protein with HEPN domain